MPSPLQEKTVQLLSFPYSMPEGPFAVVDCVVFPELPLFLELERAVPLSPHCKALPVGSTFVTLQQFSEQPFQASRRVTFKAHINTTTEQLQEQLEEEAETGEAVGTREGGRDSQEAETGEVV